MPKGPRGQVQCCVRRNRDHNPAFWAGWRACHHTHAHLNKDKTSTWYNRFLPSHRDVQHRCMDCFGTCRTSIPSARCVMQKHAAAPMWIQDTARPVSREVRPASEPGEGSGDDEPPADLAASRRASFKERMDEPFVCGISIDDFHPMAI